MNNVNLVGNLVRDVEPREGESYFMISGSIAVNDRVKKGDQWVDEPSFIDFTWFGNRAKSLAQYLTKGTKVGLTGKLKQDRWQTQAGETRTKIKVLVSDLDLLGGRNNSENNPEAYDVTDLADEDIPF